MSKAQAFLACSLSWRTQAVAGKIMSGVTVATMMRSSSSAPTPRLSRASRAAGRASALVGVPGGATWRSRIPVRVRIHSSEVSTIFSRSALVITRAGTWRPTAVMAARIGAEPIWPLGGLLSRGTVRKVAAETLLKRTVGRRSRRAAVTAGQPLGGRARGIEGEQAPVGERGGHDASPLPPSRAREGAGRGEGETSHAPQATHEGHVLHQGQVGHPPDALVGLAPGEDGLVAVGQAQEARAAGHAELDHAIEDPRRVDGEAEGASR